MIHRYQFQRHARGLFAMAKGMTLDSGCHSPITTLLRNSVDQSQKLCFWGIKGHSSFPYAYTTAFHRLFDLAVGTLCFCFESSPAQTSLADCHATRDPRKRDGPLVSPRPRSTTPRRPKPSREPWWMKIPERGMHRHAIFGSDWQRQKNELMHVPIRGKQLIRL